MPTITARVTRASKAGFSRVAKKLNTMGNLALWIGIVDGSTYSGEGNTPAGTPVGRIAAYQEYGTKRIPKRPFLKPTAKARGKLWTKRIGRLLKGTGLGEQPLRSAYELVGQEAAKDVQVTIEKMTEPALAEATVKAKKRRGKQNPEKLLVDTGTMEEAIRHRIVNEH